jgi:HEAT repeat protein
MTNSDSGARATAARTLGMVGTAEAREFLRKALLDDSFLVRYYACEALGEANDPVLIDDLAARFHDTNATVRDAASDAIARMADEAQPVLFCYLKEGKPVEKISAATAIRKARYRPAQRLLVEMMRDPVPEVKVTAVAALMTIGDKASFEPLVNGLRDPEVRWICVMALRQMGDAVFPFLLRRTGDPGLDPWKQYVLDGMGNRALDGCLDTLKKDEATDTKIATLCTMKQIKDLRAVYPLIELLGDEKLGYVSAAVLSQMGEIAVEPLLFVLKDDDPSRRARAASALGDLGAKRAIEPLRKLANDKDLVVRETAKRSLRQLSEGTAVAEGLRQGEEVPGAVPLP